MKKIILFLTLCLGLSTSLFSHFEKEAKSTKAKSAITYSFDLGRFGDKMLSYLHAKWVAYRCDLPFFYRPFEYSDRLVLDDVEPLLSDVPKSRFDFMKIFREWKDLESRNKARILYVIPYFPECLIDLRTEARRRRYFAVDWDDPVFQKEVRRLVAPKQPTKKLTLPRDKITVAVHVRKGGGYDSKEVQDAYPLKFPTHAYYIEQIQNLHEDLGCQPLYVHIFTDDLEPQKIVEDFRAAISSSHIQIHCHTPQQQETFDLIDDLFALTQFDCLIRAESHFSVVAGKLKDYLIEICPLSFHWENGEVVIDAVTKKYRCHSTL